MKDRDGRRLGLTNHEYLDLKAIGKAWRAEWIPFLQATKDWPLNIAFEGILPTYKGEDGMTSGMWWSVENQLEREGIFYLYIIDQEYNNLCVTLATEARMLAKSSLRLHALSGPPLRSEKKGGLAGQLNRLSK
jgi:hypothetical protein